MKEYRAENRNELNTAGRKHYAKRKAADPERENRTRRDWAASNPESRKDITKRYRDSHPEANNTKKRRAANLAHFKAQEQALRDKAKANKENWCETCQWAFVKPSKLTKHLLGPKHAEAVRKAAEAKRLRKGT